MPNMVLFVNDVCVCNTPLYTDLVLNNTVGGAVYTILYRVLL